MDITVRTETFGVEDRSWLASAHGTEATRTITLDPALFTPAVHFPDGVLKSGTVLAEVTARPGVYGPYETAATDGRETARGHLFTSVQMRVGGPTRGAALFEHGFVLRSKLPANHGLDAAAEAELTMIKYR